MLQLKKSLFCVMLLLQILFNTVPFINSAVIRQNALSSDETLFEGDVNPATSLGLEDDEHLLLINDVNDETTTLENLVQDAITTTTTVATDTKKDDTLPIDENTVGLSSSDIDQHIALKPVNENESKSELTSTEPEIKSTTAQINETSTVIENESTTSKEQVQTSTLFEEDSVDKTEKEDKPETTAKSVDEDTTQMLSTLFVEETTTNEDHENTTLKELNLQTSTDASTVNSTEIDSTTKTTQPVTNFKLEDSDTTVVSLLSHTELIDTSTELTNENDSKTLLINTDNEMQMTTESDLKLPEVTTELPMSTFTSTEHENKTIYPDLKGTPSNETKTSNSSSTEKRGKYIDHNYSSLNEFRLPNTSDVWALASLRSVGKSKTSDLQNSVETSEEKPANSSLITKNLHDWTRVMDTTHDMESKSALRSEEQPEKLTTDRVAPVATTINNVEELQSTVKEIESVTEITTETPMHEDVTESRMIIENEVELPTAKIEIESTTTVTVLPPLILTDKADKETTEFQMTTNDFETTTITPENNDRTTFNDNSPKDSDDTTTTVNSAKNLNIHEKTIEESDNKIDSDGDFEKETTKLPTTTTKVTFIPQFIVPERSEANDSHVNAEITHQEENTNAGTISLLTPSSSDFTTSIPLLTSSLDATTKATVVVMTDVTSTTLPVSVTSEYRVNEAPNTDSTEIPSQTTSPGRMTIESSSETTTTTTTPAPTTTSTTTMPAVIIKSATSEIQTATTTTTTTEAPHTNTITPSIISNETMMIQNTESNRNYNEYEYDSSSTEAFEATTRRVASNLTPNATTVRVVVDEEISTTEVDKLDEDLDTTTIVSDFENNNADDIETTVQSDIKTVTFAPKTHPIETATLTLTPFDVIKTSTDSNLDHIDSKHINSDTSETSIESNVIDPVQVDETSTAATTTTTTTTTTTESMKINFTDGGSDGVYSIFSTTTTTTPTPPTTTSSTTKSIYYESPTTFESISTKKEDVYSIVPTIDHGGVGGFNVPKLVLDDTTTVSTTTLMTPSGGDLGMGSGIMGGGVGAGSVLQPIDSPEGQETDVNVIIAISVSAVGIVALILLVAFLYVMRKRQKQMSYGQRCRPVSLDAYSLDNVSVYNSVRRKGATLRASKRSYGNVAFDDPSLRHNVLGTHDLARYVDKKSSIYEEFKEVPQIIARADEVPAGCEEKNRYANVIPLPETRVILQQLNGDEKSEYINANYVRGPKDTTNYYIACQAPLETTVTDFWRMIWEQNSRVIIMATDLIENGIDKCAEYLPPSVTLDNHTVFGDYQVTLKHREVKEKYAISTLMLKNTSNDESREITHYWYQWPEAGVPTDEAAIIAMLLEARSSLKASTIEQNECKIESSINDDNTTSVKIEINGNVNSDKSKMSTKDQGPLTIHCSPGTGRTGTILACDIAMRCLEEPKRTVDIPQIVYSVRRGRASAVQTKEQYEFIYKVTHMYATKISNINNDN